MNFLDVERDFPEQFPLNALRNIANAGREIAAGRADQINRGDAYKSFWNVEGYGVPRVLGEGGHEREIRVASGSATKSLTELCDDCEGMCTDYTRVSGEKTFSGFTPTQIMTAIELARRVWDFIQSVRRN